MLKGEPVAVRFHPVNEVERDRRLLGDELPSLIQRLRAFLAAEEKLSPEELHDYAVVVLLAALALRERLERRTKLGATH
jgi:hypothetical protein